MAAALNQTAEPSWFQDSSESEGDLSETEDAESGISDIEEDFVLFGDEDMEEEDIIPYPEQAETILGKDGTQWSNLSPPAATRLRRNIVTVRDGKIGLRTINPEVAAATTKLNFLKLMINSEMIGLVVVNQNATTWLQEWNLKKLAKIRPDWIETDNFEIVAFCGLLIVAGCQRLKKMIHRLTFR
ncbi:unnamed protein product [Allacma fusca]|uniref:Uncharacterized protein n=1 Tax=Allacma fusca TaxID=39272 RepID=A0A8J2L3H3_9HEXA|nr:unnamed protein product [Allacma fusca]